MQWLAGMEDHLPALQVLAGKAAILPRLACRARLDVHARRILARPLLHHHGICAGGHHAAGEDPHALSRADGGGGRFAGK